MTTASAAPNPTRTLVLCGGLHAFTHLYNVVLIPLYLPLQAGLHLTSVAQATFLVTAMLLTYGGLSYPVGMLADRFSRKWLLGLGLLVNGAAFVALAYAPDFRTALACVMLAGVGGSCYHPAATSLIVQLAPTKAGRALGLVGVGAGVGFFIGPLYAGWRAEQAGWRAPVFELGLAGCVAALLFLWLAEDPPMPPHAPDAPTNGRLLPTKGMTALFVGACALLGFRDFAGGCVASLNSLFLQNAQGYNVAQVGLALSLVFLGSTISNPLFGHLSDRGRLRWITLILVCSGVLVGVFPHVPPAAVKPVLFVYGFFFLASFPTTEAALMVAVPAATRGRAFGVFLTFGFVVGNLAHWVAGEWVRRLGDRASQTASYFGFYAGLGLLILASLSALLCLGALRRRQQAITSGAGPRETRP